MGMTTTCDWYFGNSGGGGAGRDAPLAALATHAVPDAEGTADMPGGHDVRSVDV